MSFSRHLLKDGKFMHHNKYAYKTISWLLFSSTIEDAFLRSTPIVLFAVCPLCKVIVRVSIYNHTVMPQNNQLLFIAIYFEVLFMQ